MKFGMLNSRNLMKVKQVIYSLLLHLVQKINEFESLPTRLSTEVTDVEFENFAAK